MTDEPYLLDICNKLKANKKLNEYNINLYSGLGKTKSGAKIVDEVEVFRSKSAPLRGAALNSPINIEDICKYIITKEQEIIRKKEDKIKYIAFNQHYCANCKMLLCIKKPIISGLRYL